MKYNLIAWRIIVCLEFSGGALFYLLGIIALFTNPLTGTLCILLGMEFVIFAESDLIRKPNE